MTKTLIRGGAAIALAGLAALTPTVAHAGDASVQETRVFTGFASENSPKEAKRDAEKRARQNALISGYLNEQCVLLYANSSRLGPGYYWADAAISCTR
ncbi:hypothetical protein OHA91_35745 [Streptomyces erythrochromogenes]|uniref:Uncharacterized protein n=1 Tax=Streptomyces erythrochromogenes TaxID=285574 RepID=A0ABZ1QL30_9ACTN|nr:hypothetical protein [Streptomyces erythrochromogenes]MCX5589212.1 hypothetical protein [Streptomyces erythrochromogenes]